MRIWTLRLRPLRTAGVLLRVLLQPGLVPSHLVGLGLRLLGLPVWCRQSHRPLRPVVTGFGPPSKRSCGPGLSASRWSGCRLMSSSA